SSIRPFVHSSIRPQSRGPPMIHMNYASQALLPEVSARAAATVYAQYAAAGSLPFDVWRGIADTARRRAADLAKVPPSDIAFVASTTHGLHCAMHLVPWEPGDRVVVSGAFPTILAPWMYGELPGVRPEFLPWTDPDAVLAGIAAAAARGPVRAVFVDWVHYITGRALPLEKVRLLIGPDGYLVADVMQGLGLLPSPARHVDIMVAGGTKWLMGPEGTGILYLNPARRWNSGPVGWLSAEYEGFTHCMPPRPPDPGARRLEAGTRNTPGIAALSQSINLILEAGDPWRVVQPMVQALISGGRELGLQPSADRPESGIVGLAFPDPVSVAAVLLDRGVRVSARDTWLRISPHFVNTMDEVQALLSILALLAG
ncbi:aminotransferase class V-fold PLP-dependent enzyme, partial [Candidatus Fermentibacteria bacterium]|nr:aminotransferase class V-fold PLP-dependent enzyme [Candidatus Fermentibacteria bacterium]